MPGEFAEKVAERRDAVQRESQFSIREMLAQPPAAAPRPAEPQDSLPPMEDLSPLPGPGTPYSAHARASSRPLPLLVLLFPDASARGFSYSNLETLDCLCLEPGQGPSIVAVFTGILPLEVTITGRRLDALYSYLGHHRLHWIRVLPQGRDFQTQDATVVTSISIRPFRPTNY